MVAPAPDHLISSSGNLHSPLLDGGVDHRGQFSRRTSSGGWRSSSFIIGVAIAERLAFFGISANLINYLTGPLGQSVATAAENVNLWSGTAYLSPLLGAFVADTFFSRYHTIVVASVLYIVALGLLTFSAIIPSVIPTGCQITSESSCLPPTYQVVLFFFSLYLAAIVHGGHMPCVQAFGADQFDGKNSEERKARSSFFNWWCFCVSAGTSMTMLVLPYIQDNLGWTLGFGLPCISMLVALLLFLFGTKTYRVSVRSDEKGPFLRFGSVFISAFRNRKANASAVDAEQASCGSLTYEGYDQFKFLNKALLAQHGSKEEATMSCSFNELEEAKAVLRLIPIWLTCLVHAIIHRQPPTFFTKQGATMDRSITPNLQLPSAALQSLIGITNVIFVLIYDRILVPATRTITGKPSGITMLQRIGTGMALSMICMVLAALVETKRLNIARQHGLIDNNPNEPLPIKIWWLVPQFVVLGISDVFTMVGLQEFFYDQVPTEWRSIGLALYLSILGIGSFMGSFLVSAIDKATSSADTEGWFANDLNQAHLDYFYWVLAGMSLFELIAFICFAKSYIYKRRSLS